MHATEACATASLASINKASCSCEPGLRCERICGVLRVVGHVEELLGAAFDEGVQRVLHQLQVLQLSLELLLGRPQEAGDLTASSAQTTVREHVY